MPSLHELGEFEVIRQLTRGFAEPPGVVVGAGDDAAVLRPSPGCDVVVTTDAFLEGRHWLPEWCGPADLGARLAVANLSDLAAMAALPRWALLAAGVRPSHETASLIEMERALAGALGAEGAVLVGGNLTAVTEAEWLTLTLLGEVERGRAWTRSGARPGDLLAVTGHPGRAGAGLRLARALGDAARAAAWRPLIGAWLAPRARIAQARALLATGAVTAAVDVSDGLVGDLGHLCAASGVGAALDTLGPADPELERAAAALETTGEDLRLDPSDDYELLVALDPAQAAAAQEVMREQGVPFTMLGRLTDAPGVLTRAWGGAPGALEERGFDHFR